MDWKYIKFDWNHAKSFLVTVEEGSLSAASKALGLNQSTLGRQVNALENELGIVLFERVGKGLELTPHGVELLEYVREMSDAASKFSLSASGKSESLDGSVYITATLTMSYYILPKIIAKLKKKHPGITIEIIAKDSFSDLRKREADIAIRHAKPAHNDLIAKKIKSFDAYLYASKSYLKIYGSYNILSKYNDAKFVGFPDSNEYIQGLKSLGINITNDNFSSYCQNHMVHWEMVKEGLGIGIMIDFIADKEKKVQKIVKNMPNLPYDTWLVTHRELNTNRKIRVVYDFLNEEMNKLFN